MAAMVMGDRAHSFPGGSSHGKGQFCREGALRAGTLGSGWGTTVSTVPLVLMPGKKLVSYELCPPSSQETHSTHFLSELSSQMIFFKRKDVLIVACFKKISLQALSHLQSPLFFPTTLK